MVGQPDDRPPRRRRSRHGAWTGARSASPGSRRAGRCPSRPARRVPGFPPQSSNARSTNARSSASPVVVVDERRLVGDESARYRARARPEPPAHRVEVDVGQRDAVAGDRLQAGRPAPAARRACGRARACCQPPARTGSLELAGPPTTPVRVAPDLARLDLEDEQAPIRMGDHDVGLALLTPSRARARATATFESTATPRPPPSGAGRPAPLGGLPAG